MFFTFVTIIHVLVCLTIVGVVLLQQGKGASMGAAFGTAGSQTVFGSSGAGNFLSRVTAVCAAIFFTTSLVLAFRSNFHRSVVEGASPIEEPAGSTNEPVKADNKEEAKAPPAGQAAEKPAAGNTPVTPAPAHPLPVAPAPAK
jgi:preprotein translocase subunit SecG